jgi:hypothetical protein
MGSHGCGVGLENAADNFAVRQYVVIHTTPLAGRARGRGAFSIGVAGLVAIMNMGALSVTAIVTVRSAQRCGPFGGPVM